MIFTYLLAALIHEQTVAGHCTVPSQAPTDAVSLLVGSKFKPSTECDRFQLVVACLFLGAQFGFFGLYGVGVFTKACPLFESHGKFGATGGVAFLA